jgi:phosphate transport system permease protein
MASGAMTSSTEPSGLSASDPWRPISTWRKVKNHSWWLLCGLGLLLVVIPVLWIIGGVLDRAVAHWQWSVLTTSFNGTGGGLSNYIVGTVVLMIGTAILAGLVGIGCGIYLAEFARSNRSTILRTGSEILAGIPSIVFGFIGYVTLVTFFHWGYSIYAALIVLSLVVVPYVAKGTEVAIANVPVAYREAADGLGMSRTHLLRTVVLRAALPGIANGLVIALAISVGETAPLLYTAGSSNGFPTFSLHNSPLGYLTYAAYTFWDDPSTSVNILANDAALLLVVLVLVLIVVSRIIVGSTQKYSDRSTRR